MTTATAFANELDGQSPFGRNESQLTELVKLAEAEAIELFRTAGGETYASVRIGKGIATWPIRGDQFRDWLGYIYYLAHKRAIGRKVREDAADHLHSKALFDEGYTHEVFVRVAEQDGKVYIDIGDNLFRVIEVDSRGWRTIPRAPVKFWRPDGFQALAIPQQGGDWADLWKYLNVRPEDRVLLQAWMLAALRPGRPYPVLILQAEQGAGKSTAEMVLKRLLDPNYKELRSTPDKVESLAVAVKNDYVLTYDNMSGISKTISDAFSQIATGGTFTKRTNYTDGDEYVIKAQRPIILAGITDVVSRSDLLDRAIIVRLPALTSQKRRAEDAFWAEFDADRPFFVGLILDSVSASLRNDAGASYENPVGRFPQFERMAAAAEESWGVTPGTFRRAYAENREEVHATALDSNSVARAVRKFMETRQEWQGEAHELLTLLNQQMVIEFAFGKPKDWPGASNSLVGKLNELVPDLRSVGIGVETGRRQGRSKKLVVLKRLE